MNVNTKVREYISELEKALEDEELIVDQHLLERFSSLAHRLSHIRKQSPKRLRQARSSGKRKIRDVS